MKYKSKTIPKRGISVMLSLLMLVSLAVSSLRFDFTSAEAVSDPNYYYYDTDYASGPEVRAASLALNKEIVDEGYVLLENKNNFLPMSAADFGGTIDVSLFGKNSAAIAYFGYGSSDSVFYDTPGRETTSFYDAFNGTDFNVNPQLKAFYQNAGQSGSGRLNGGLHNTLDNNRAGLPTGETPYASYTTAAKNSYSSYNEAAIVMLTRIMGEGSDLPKTSLNNWENKSDANKLSSARKWDDHYLQLDKNEVELLQNVMRNFDNVVILLNSSGPMEVGFLQDPTHYLFTDNGFTSTPQAAEEQMAKLKAALVVGLPGTDGCLEIPRILTGEVNPSGHLTDTWTLNMKNDPTWQNQGYNGDLNGAKYGETFVHYDEDIYLGYRYYETRYVTEENGDEWYDSQVQYPFGHGLSYTNFDWELISSENSGEGDVLDKFGTITTKVKVTNNGSRAGKDVVQLYYNTPYYDGGISKAHVELAGFAKTGLLAPGVSETVEITLKVSDMYSYDWSDANGNDFKGYELEHGNYNIVAAPNAHEAAKLGGDFTTTYKIETDYIYEYDTTTGAPITNLFDDVSGSGRVNDPSEFKGVRRYMTRDDFEGTFPTSAESKKTGLEQRRWQYTINPDFDENSPWYSGTMPTQAETPGNSETNKVKLWHLRGRDYDDPLWDALLDQLTIAELAKQIENGFFGTRPIASIDKPIVYDDDGPLGRRHSPDVQWGSNPLLAQTFNTDIAFRQGKLFGEAVLWGVNHADGAPMNNAPSGQYTSEPDGRGGIYGIGVNTHRSPFGGRNFEYYSECGVLAGKMAAQVSLGSIEKGCYQIIKHLMLNDQESFRKEVQTWASEQAMREIYGKPFEIIIKEGGAIALMAGFNYIGDTSCSENWALLTGLVRNEWGFRGFVITDFIRMPVNMCIRAGCNTMMVHNEVNPPSVDPVSLTPTQATAIRESAKSIFYAMANSNGVHGVGGEPLNMIDYGGVNTLYAIEGVDNEIAVDNAKITISEETEVVYTIKDSLPQGMELSEDGILSGAPEESGDYTFTINADEETEAYYPYKTAAKTFKLKVFAPDKIPDSIIYEDDNIGVIPYGFEFSQSIRSAVVFDQDGKLTTNVNYSLTADSELPRGLILENGIISGIATAEPGSYFFTVLAEAEGKNSVELDFIVRIKAYKIEYPSVEIGDMLVGKSVTLSVAQAYSLDNIAIRYTLKEGDKLPNGLSLSSTGVISGIPTKAYTDYEFTVVARGDLAPPAEVTYSVSVRGIEMNDIVFSGILMEKNYSFKLNAFINDGGDAKISYALKSGSNLPSGYILLSDGTLIGRGAEYGNQTFTVIISAEGYTSVEANVSLDLYQIFDAPLGSEQDAEPLLTLPTPPQSNLALILILAIGLPILALGAFGTIFIIKKNKQKEGTNS